jgi:predicted amidohydrolase
MDDQGKIAGVYRKSHLNAQDQKWAIAGNELSVFNTSLGRIALILSDEVRIPDIASVLAAKRADIIAVPSSWAGQYGGPVLTDPGLVLQPFPTNTMSFWFNLAKYAQAYTVVTNYVGGTQNYKGSSGLYSLDSVQGHFPPTLAADNMETAFYVSFPTIGSPDWWLTQEYLNIGQRVDLNTPLTLNAKNTCLIQWQTKTMENNFCWNH